MVQRGAKLDICDHGSVEAFLLHPQANKVVQIIARQAHPVIFGIDWENGHCANPGNTPHSSTLWSTEEGEIIRNNTVVAPTSIVSTGTITVSDILRQVTGDFPFALMAYVEQYIPMASQTDTKVLSKDETLGYILQLYKYYQANQILRKRLEKWPKKYGTLPNHSDKIVREVEQILTNEAFFRESRISLTDMFAWLDTKCFNAILFMLKGSQKAMAATLKDVQFASTPVNTNSAIPLVQATHIYHSETRRQDRNAAITLEELLAIAETHPNSEDMYKHPAIIAGAARYHDLGSVMNHWIQKGFIGEDTRRVNALLRA